MIAHIRGLLEEKDPTRVVIEAAGVGYELFIPLSTYEKLPHLGEEVKLLTAHIVREDDEILFGFATAGEREMFSLLVSVSGVGPKIALAILSGSSLSELSLAISSGNFKRLSSIKGVGKKTAEKICVELKDRVSAFSVSARGDETASPILRDAALALAALGFTEQAASELVAKVMEANPELKDVEAVIRKALAAR